MPILHIMALAHHRAEDVHRCLLLPIGGRRLAICARCAALYPTLLVTVVLHAWLHARPWGRIDWLLILGAELPMMVNWAAGRLRPRQGPNGWRLVTGVAGGIGLGRAFYLYFQDPRCEVFWGNLVLIGIGVLAVELVRARGLRDPL